jgi:hypothetical protein
VRSAVGLNTSASADAPAPRARKKGGEAKR